MEPIRPLGEQHPVVDERLQLIHKGYLQKRVLAAAPLTAPARAEALHTTTKLYK